jgi:hypothetical protein
VEVVVVIAIPLKEYSIDPAIQRSETDSQGAVNWVCSGLYGYPDNNDDAARGRWYGDFEKIRGY